ncbi:MAG: 3'-5' exonuclease [Candidatus Aenigmarchaeota archaeon]|nr:3'-5' exonuclease [Candidatus Aenigmarchaeota archaeon]
MIIVDVETTGLDPIRNSILSIGALDLSNPKNQFYGECGIWKGASISKTALKINGFTRKQIRDNKKTPGELLKEFLEWAKRTKTKKIGGYYTRFDYSFLKSTADRFSIKFPFSPDVLDLHDIFCKKMGMDKAMYEGILLFSLNEIMISLGMPPEPDPHNALRGAKYTAEGISRVKNGKNLLKEFMNYPVTGKDGMQVKILSFG